MKSLSPLMKEALERIGDERTDHVGYSHWYGHGCEGGTIAPGGEMTVHFSKKIEKNGRWIGSQTFHGRTARALFDRGLIQAVEGSFHKLHDTHRGWTTVVSSCRVEITEAGKKLLAK